MGRDCRIEGERWDEAREAASALSDSSGSFGRGPFGGFVGGPTGCGGVRLIEKACLALVGVNGASGLSFSISDLIASNAVADGLALGTGLKVERHLEDRPPCR